MQEKIFEKRNVEPDLDILTSLFGNNLLSAFITGHLIIESLVMQMIHFKGQTNEAIIKKNFPTKLKMCVDLEYFDEKLESFLLLINDIRNIYAHNLGYHITYDEIFTLVKKANEAGIDFSDDTIFSNKNEAEKWYGIVDTVQEIFQNTALELSSILEENGGEFKFA